MKLSEDIAAARHADAAVLWNFLLCGTELQVPSLFVPSRLGRQMHVWQQKRVAIAR